jgi:hypothetical protein
MFQGDILTFGEKTEESRKKTQGIQSQTGFGTQYLSNAGQKK